MTRGQVRAHSLKMVVVVVVVVVEYYSFLRNIIVGTPGARPARFVYAVCLFFLFSSESSRQNDEVQIARFVPGGFSVSPHTKS